jgi:hypothetical protein
MDFEQDMLEGLKNIKLMADEEEDITFEDEYWGKAFSECTPILFGRFFTKNFVNNKAARETLRSM